ncbi:MAG: hypothetical protein AAF481_15855 [Acidobacteriota bacterium]
MKRAILPVALSVAFLAALVFALVGSSRMPASSLSKGPAGWMGARLLLEQAGIDAALHDPGMAAGEGVLVEIFPWPLSPSRRAERIRRVVEQRAAGGDLLVAYSGKNSPGESDFFARLGCPLEQVRSEPPLSYGAWKRHQEEVWSLEPLEPSGYGLVLSAPTWAPAPPDGAEIWFRGPGGEELVYAFDRRGGRTVVLPAPVLANSGLWRGDNASLVFALAGYFPPTWRFDEQGLGIEDPETAAAAGRYRRVFTWFGFHLLVLYGLGVLALGRRFGPPWREPPVVVGSTGAFLRSLGRLHRQSGHHRSAARALLDRSDAWVDGRSVPAAWRDEAATAGPPEFLNLARRLARWRRRGK